MRYHFTSVRALLAEAATAATRQLLDQLAPALELAGSPRVALALLLGFLCHDNGDNGDNGDIAQDRASLLFAETCLAATRDESLHRALDQALSAFRYRLAVVLAARGVAAPEATAAVLDAAVRAFSHVAERMHHRLAELAPDEREEVEHASKLLRRARAATQLPVITRPSPPGETG